MPAFRQAGTGNLNDNPGMAIFYNSGNLIEFSEDEESMVIKFKLDNKEINYNFATAWEKEKDGIKNIDEFRKCLETMTVMLNNTLLLKLLWAGIL